jgi:hypothetical protein
MRDMRMLAVILLTATGAVPSPAQTPASRSPADPQHALLDRLIGTWVLRGVIAKQQTTHDIEARWVLNKEYVQIHETSREKDATGKPQYEALVLVVWEPKAGEYACLWLDTTGVSLFAPEGVGRAKPAGDTIPFFFKDATGGVHNTFAYDRAKDAWSWTIDNEVNGKLTPFARVTLTRK